MSEHLFGVGRGRVSAKDRARIDKIARGHKATFVNPNMPGDGYRYWFATRDLGYPFNDRTARDVLDEIHAAGIRLPGE